MAAVVREWERGDALMWSLIVSPEDAARMDLRGHVRDLVAEMERDLGTRLEWVAIDHHNTDNEHVHLLIRGVRDDGRTLTLDRDYVSRGIRELSRELAERELGPRDEQEYLQTRARSIEREYWTEIDRTLERRAGIDRVVSYENLTPFTEGARVRAEAGNGAAGISRKAWAGAPDRRTQLGTCTRARAGIAPPATRTGHHSKPSA